MDHINYSTRRNSAARREKPQPRLEPMYEPFVDWQAEAERCELLARQYELRAQAARLQAIIDAIGEVRK